MACKLSPVTAEPARNTGLLERPKANRRVTRFDKLKRNYKSVVAMACAFPYSDMPEAETDGEGLLNAGDFYSIHYLVYQKVHQGKFEPVNIYRNQLFEIQVQITPAHQKVKKDAFGRLFLCP